MTLQNAPPGLDYERDKKFSKVIWFVSSLPLYDISLIPVLFVFCPKSFKQMIASCLVKDPSKRPSAKKLLKHSFFRQAKSNEFIARKLLEGLPALGDRLQALKVPLFFFQITLTLLNPIMLFQLCFTKLINWFVGIIEKGRRYACAEEDTWWTEGGNVTGMDTGNMFIYIFNLWFLSGCPMLWFLIGANMPCSHVLWDGSC